METIFLVYNMSVYRYVGLSLRNPYKKYICQNAWVELRGLIMCMLKISFGSLKQIADYNFRSEFLILPSSGRL